MNGYYETAVVFLDTLSNVNSQDKGGSTPLHHAAKNGHFKVVELLLERGAMRDLRDKVRKGFVCVLIPCVRMVCQSHW